MVGGSGGRVAGHVHRHFMSTPIHRSLLRRTPRSWQIKCRGFSARAVQDFDVVIVGGGPAGLALASGLGASHTLDCNRWLTAVRISF